MPDRPALRSVPPDGSLGLLAYGYQGLIAWRAARGTDWLDAERERIERDEGRPAEAATDLADVEVMVVSGLPRSGTSMLMQMLKAGGCEPFVDGERQPDLSNPRGYYEHGRIKGLPRDTGWIPDADGLVAKVVAPLLPHLPVGPQYRVILLNRSLDEILNSQRRMLERQQRPVVDDAVLRSAYTRLFRAARRWAETTDGASLLELDHAEILANPADAALQIAGFLGTVLNVDAMASTVDPSLHRERA